METLYLGGNQIGHVPDSIGSMHSLIVLNLSDNRLRTLPRSISRKTEKQRFFHLVFFLQRVNSIEITLIT